jgi:polyhydroxybutyrate depolymerase
VLALPATTAAGRQGPVVAHWTIDGVQRTAIVFAPASTTGAARHPLVFAFHGHGGNAQQTAVLMHLQTVWPRAVVVYPQGLNTQTPLDPAGIQTGWQFKYGDSNNRDLELFDAMVTTLKQRYRIDSRRIYTTGFSNGAFFSYLLWAQRAKTIAAVSEVAGGLDPAETLTTPRALLAVVGKHDTTSPVANQLSSVDQARQADDATGPGLPCGPICTFYPSSSGSATPVETLIHQGGHVYPPWAPLQIVRFFQAHARP